MSGIKLQVTPYIIILAQLIAQVISTCWVKDSYLMCLTTKQSSERTQIGFTVSSSNPTLESNLKLVARIGTRSIQQKGTYEGEGFQYNVTYNTCTNSDRVDRFCDGVQASFKTNVSETSVPVSFHLHSKFDKSYYTTLHQESLELQTSEGTENPITSEVKVFTNVGKWPEITNITSGEKGAIRKSDLPYPTGLIGWVLAVVFLVLFLLTLGVLMIVKCKSGSNKTKDKKDLEQSEGTTSTKDSTSTSPPL